MSKDVMIVTGAGQISMAIARRMGYGKKIILGDKNENNAQAVAEIMNQAGFDVEPFVMDMSSRNCPAGRPGTADEVADVAELLMSERAQLITGSTFLVDGGATASYYYGPLQP